MQEQTKRFGSIKQPDFIMIPTQLLSDDSLQPLDRILFGYIYWMTKLALMKCVAGNITLAQLTHASQRGVANSLNRLEKNGYISRIYQDESNRVRVEILCLVAFNTQVTSTEDTLHQMMKPLHETMKHVTSNDEQNKNNRIRIYKKNNTNVLGANAPSYGKPEINDLFSYWQTVIGFKLESRIKQNRMACNNLLRKHGADKLKRIIAGVALTYADPFAPRINDFISLQGRMNDLLAWGNKRQNATPNVVKIK